MSDSEPAPQQQFFSLLEAAMQNASWVKLTLGKYRGSEIDLQRATVRTITLREQPMLSFVYSYRTRDITRNLSPAEGLATIRQLLDADFRNAHFVGATAETQLEIGKKGKARLHTRTPQRAADAGPVAENRHDREKKRFVAIDSAYLSALGVTDREHRLIPSMARKWKQINKFIEVFSQAFANSGLNAQQPLSVVDFGAGKGYLTFALHDYLRSTLHNSARVTGVELRAELVDLCNTIAASLQSEGLSFVCGDVKTHAPQTVDVMIALHACDTATDHAIHYGIRANAAIIMCSPCCHKQIRPQLRAPALLKPMLQYGVHLGQQAEMVTDALRALLLEANGYSTKVFEFISLEHTDKNKMILAVKRQHAAGNEKVLDEIAALKAFYGIEEHCLETLLQNRREID